MGTSYSQLDAPAQRRSQGRWSRAALAIVLISSFLLSLHHLGHPALKGLDESFHAVVARNMLKHPLKPTLIDEPYLDVPASEWQVGHVWLHKPALPMWQIAISFAVFGVNAFALRLPSAILATAAAGLTYLIGREVFDRRTALFATTLQAFTPAIVMLVHGYTFSDHVDVALLFWVELGMWLVVMATRTGKARYVVLAGAAQGLGFLCKTYPALIVTAVAGFMWVMTHVGRVERESSRLKFSHVLMLIAAAIVTVAPWLIYCAVHYPNEFRAENALILRHLNENVEGWAGPWDRLIFDFSLRIFYVFYPAVLLAMIVLAPRAWREKQVGLWFAFAWGLGVLIPHTFAITKTPSATLVGWPAMWLLLGAMISRAIAGEIFLLLGWLAIALLAVFFRGQIPQQGMGYPEPRVFAGVMRQTIWVAWHVLAALAIAGIGTKLLRRALDNHRIRLSLIAVASALTVALAAQLVHASWLVTKLNRTSPDLRGIGAYAAANLPNNAVLLVDEREKLDFVSAMFWADRTCYPIRGQGWQELARQVAQKGGAPYIVTDQPVLLRRVYFDPVESRSVYVVGPEDLRLPATQTTQPSN
jgi:4-amino-4-deoxy-L-arabinose transferase